MSATRPHRALRARPGDARPGPARAGRAGAVGGAAGAGAGAAAAARPALAAAAALGRRAVAGSRSSASRPTIWWPSCSRARSGSAALSRSCSAVTLAGALGLVGRELNSLRRLARAEHLRQEGERLLNSEVHGQAGAAARAHRATVRRPRRDCEERLAAFHGQASDALSDGEQLRLFAATVLGPLDQSAYQLVLPRRPRHRRADRAEPARAARRRAGARPHARMLRAIARLYGVRPGAVASLTLLRRTLAQRPGGRGRRADERRRGRGDRRHASEHALGARRPGRGQRAARGQARPCRDAALPAAAVHRAELPSLRQLRAELFK